MEYKLSDWTPEHWSWLEKRFQLLMNEARILGFNHNQLVALPTHSYWVDFANPDMKLGFEVDSEKFHSSVIAKSRDTDRQEKLEEAGWTIVRFKSEAILRRPDWVKKEMKRAVEKAASKSPNRLT